MRTSLRRWLLQRRAREMKPLCQRATWYDFAGKMHETLARDMRILMDEAAPEDFYARPTAHITRIIDQGETIVDPGRWWQYDDTIEDHARTALIETVLMPSV